MSMPETNRELYLAIGDLATKHKTANRSLEHYLLAILGLVQQHDEQTGLSLSDFHRLLSDAFTAEPLAFDEMWLNSYETLDGDCSVFEGWKSTVIRQIVDLHEMEQTGALANEYRYFGINSPRGSYWYNFDPATYIECAMAGSLGGWEPEDGTGRQFVPGEVAFMDGSGEIRVGNPQDVERPIVELPLVSWELFKDFVECGQMYE
jgi:hypothetical protein